MERKHIVSFIIIVLSVAVVSSLCTFAIVTNNMNQRIHEAVSGEKQHYSTLLDGIDTFLEVKGLVDLNFVEDVDYEEIEDALCEYYVELLGDKYSEYLTKEKLDSYMNKISGSFVGIGIVCSNKNGKIHVEEVYQGAPAESAGIKSGENIIEVNGMVVNEENYDKATEAVIGEEGTTVNLKIESQDGAVREISVKRQKIDTPTVKSEMLDGKIGYIAISQFSINTADAFNKALDELLNQGAKGILFDVRNNSGGELECVTKILDRLLPQGPIVNIIYGSGKTEVRNSTNEQKLELPMAVLINENTASAAELFSAALRDYNLAELFGTVTYGKGYMQSIVPLSDGNGLRMSVAKYNPPYGDNYEGVGVNPHTVVYDDAATEVDEQLEKAKSYFSDK